MSAVKTYNMIAESKMIMGDIYALYWEETLWVELYPIIWVNSYTECIKWTIITKLRSFFFQLRTKDIITNHNLKNENC